MKLAPVERRFLAVAKMLWTPGTPLVVALSGGIDSMALYALVEAIDPLWPARLHPVHVNHQLRPEAHDEAQWLTQYLQGRWSRPLRVMVVTVPDDAPEGMEAAARRARYRALYAVAEELGADARILVAHQQNDQAETVLMRVLTGTGIRGLGAMAPHRGRIVRPLLGFTRQELQEYLLAGGVQWLEDPSNQQPDFLRNRIRHEVLPLLERTVNPRAIEALAGLAERAQEHHQALTYLLHEWIGTGRVIRDGDALRLARGWDRWPEEVFALVLREHAEAHGLRLSRRHVLAARAGFSQWPAGWVVRRLSTGELWIGPGAPAADVVRADTETRLPRNGLIDWGPGRIWVDQRPYAGPTSAGSAVINAERWPELWVRTWRPGDRIRPLGMGGHSKKLQDVFTDAKIGFHERRQWPVIVGEEESLILAVPGVVVAEEARAAMGQLVYLIQYRSYDASS
ncbi:MAG: tRNA lysidine(34) synthetase TilS [Firmicutes bacterium]|nr:tRNA lysidine(34) synthetase TilS [Bacillota bacterium]